MKTHGLKLLCISIHQHNSDENDQHTDDVERLYVFSEKKHAPKHGPAYRKRPVCIGDRQIKVSDNLLPQNRVETETAQLKEEPAEADPGESVQRVPEELNRPLVPRCYLRADARSSINNNRSLNQKNGQKCQLLFFRLRGFRFRAQYTFLSSARTDGFS